MLEYERKLHLDKNYEKFQSSRTLKILMNLVSGIFRYVIAYGILKYIMRFIPSFHLWSNYETWVTFFTIPLLKCDLIFFLVGIVLYGLESIHIGTIIAQNHSIKDQNGDSPNQLLTDGVYSTLRHPMYGAFIILEACVLLSIGSLYGVFLTIAFIILHYCNAFYEEKKNLIPQFRDKYINYMKTTHRMLLRKWEVFVLAVAIIINLIGLVY